MTRSNLFIAALAAAFPMTACGGDDGGEDSPDASTAPDAEEDDEPDAAPPGGCDFTEANDSGNGTTGEATGLSTGGAALTICGEIDMNAPDANGLVDVDLFQITGTAGGVRVRISASPGANVAVMAVEASVEAGGLGSGLLVGDHAVFLTQLEDGSFNVAAVAANATTPGAVVPYEITITADPYDGCPTAAAASFTEANDGATNINNDMVHVDFTDGPDLSPLATDVPEPSGVTVANTGSSKLAGTLALNASAAADEYLDKDTFLITTGANTEELAMRVNWPGTDSDLDFFLFPVPAGAEVPQLQSGTLIGNMAPEYQVTAVLPNTQYWVWVGNYDGSAEPKTYEVTLCGASAP